MSEPTRPGGSATEAAEHLLIPVIGRHLSPDQRELAREGTTMALYISLSQLAVLLALPATTVNESGRGSLSLLVLMTSIGLVVAHQLAFRISSRLVDHEGSVVHLPKVMRAQLIGGAVSTGLAMIPLLLFGSHALWLSSVVLTTFVCWVAFLAARSIPVGRMQALRYTGLVFLAISLLTVLKVFVLH